MLSKEEIGHTKEGHMKRTKCVAGITFLVVLCFSILAIASPGVVLNEIAWGGTEAGSQDEWIELYNASDGPVDLTGWELRIGETQIPLGVVDKGTLDIRRTTIPAGGYFLLERTDDETVSDVAADLIYKGSLSNTGADVRLLDANGAVVDEILCSDSGWPAGCGGDGEFPYATMERQEPLESDSGWASCAGDGRCGLDAAGAPLQGTPRAQNTATRAYRSAPRVELIAPSGERETSPILIQWSASDPDGDAAALRLRIDVSVDGAEWTGLVENLANAGSYLWDASEWMGQSQVQVRIVAEDSTGMRGDAESRPFSIAGP
jgi:hypothetical protein